MNAPSSRSGAAGISRRTLAVGAAWAVPALVAVAFTPAVAASPPEMLTVQLRGACKYAGKGSCKSYGKGYRLYVEVCNQTGADVFIYSATLALASEQLAFAESQLAWPIGLSSGDCILVQFFAAATNSSNQVLSGDVLVEWGHTAEQADDPIHAPIVSSMVVSSTPPECGCASDWQVAHSATMTRPQPLGYA